MMMILRVGAAIALVSAACGKVEVPPPDDRQTVVELSATANRDLDLLAEMLRTAIGSPCVEATLADVRPGTAGLQVDCVVEDLIGASAIEIESCEENLTARPCWRLEADAATCQGFLSLKLVVQRDAPPDPTAVTRMRCTVEP